MGYETRYSLKTVRSVLDEKDPLVTVLGEKPRKLPDFEKMIVDLDEYNPFEDRCKWYDHEERMKDLSAKFPHVLFVLEGFGEEDGDVWRKYFRAGKMFRADAVLSFPPPPKTMTDKLDKDELFRATDVIKSSRQ